MKEYFDNIFKDIDDSICLDEEQRRVVMCERSRIMVIAGAGSGKTTTMVAKVKYLVEIKRINPHSIILISFTNKAVDELKYRINQQMKIPCDISTFHSLASKILRNNGYHFKINTFPHKIVENFFKIYKKEAKWLKNVEYSTEILKLYKNNPIVFHRKTKFWVNLIKLYNYYKSYMQENSLMDFEDMINECNSLLKEKVINLDYQYIIIDEFQDISYNRYELVENIHRINNCSIIAVGDDWQAIFSFAGSNINLFYKFSETAEVLKITNTYRNSQELIDIASAFILKNTSQIEKKLNSIKKLNNPINIVSFFKHTKALCKVLDKLVKEYGLNQRILLIGRYQFDIDCYIDNKKLERFDSKIVYKKYQDLSITFLTVHKSKGLGYDNVIILNMNNGVFGFPSLKETDKIKRKLLNTQESYLYAEESRLFYVALTRTKNKVYILYKFNCCSIFIKELLKTHKINKTKIII